MIYLINSPVLTDFGIYEYNPIGVDEVKTMLTYHEFTSAIGHKSTAIFLSNLFGIPVPYNRITIKQTLNDILIIIKLKIRNEANKEYTKEEIEETGYELGILIRKQ